MRSVPGGNVHSEYIKQQATAYSALLLLQPAVFSGAAAPSVGSGARLFLNVLCEETRQRPMLKANFIPDLVNYLRKLQLPGYRVLNQSSALQDNAKAKHVEACLYALLAGEPTNSSLDSGGMLHQIIKSVSKVFY